MAALMFVMAQLFPFQQASVKVVLVQEEVPEQEVPENFHLQEAVSPAAMTQTQAHPHAAASGQAPLEQGPVALARL